MKMSFHSQADKTHFRMKGFARGLALKKKVLDDSEMAYSVISSFREHFRAFRDFVIRPTFDLNILGVSIEHKFVLCSACPSRTYQIP